MRDVASGGTIEATKAPEAALERVGAAMALAILLVTFVTLSPFYDLGEPRILELSSGNETVTYIALFLLVALAALVLAGLGRLTVRPLATRANLVLLAWLGVSVVLSTNPSTSARRLVLTLMTFALAAMLPWLASGLRQFASLLLATVATVLVLCYLGVLVVPHLTIHQLTDVVDPEVAGDWRGIYGHKNIAAPMMVVFIFFGWFAARVGKPHAGIAVALGAFVFLILTGGKSALGMLLVSACLMMLIVRARSLAAQAVIAFLPLALITLLTVGSVASESMRAIVAALPIDATFTGRTEIWSFALDAISAHPLTGYGFEAFWYSEQVRFGAEDSTRWMVEVATSHNSYIDLALTIGLPGLAIVIVAFLLVPLRDFHNTLDTPANREFARLFVVLWLFALYFATFEAFFLSRASPMWFVLAFATCGLRYTSRYIVRD
jgi:O-antigen ligase